MTIKYLEGDLFEAIPPLKGEGTVVIAHVCNDQGRMGSGFVIPLAQQFPDAKRAYEEWHRGHTDKQISDYSCYEGHPEVESTKSFGLGQTQFVQVLSQREVDSEQYPRVVVANMVAQTLGGERPLYYNHLVRCMEQVASLHFIPVTAQTSAKETGIQIICPLFGAARAGGDWNFVEKLIEDCWISQKIDVTVYYLEQFLPNNWTPPDKQDTGR